MARVCRSWGVPVSSSGSYPWGRARTNPRSGCSRSAQTRPRSVRDQGRAHAPRESWSEPTPSRAQTFSCDPTTSSGRRLSSRAFGGPRDLGTRRAMVARHGYPAPAPQDASLPRARGGARSSTRCGGLRVALRVRSTDRDRDDAHRRRTRAPPRSPRHRDREARPRLGVRALPRRGACDVLSKARCVEEAARRDGRPMLAEKFLCSRIGSLDSRRGTAW